MRMKNWKSRLNRYNSESETEDNGTEKSVQLESIVFEVDQKSKAGQIRQRLAKKVGVEFLENVVLFFEKGQKARLSEDQVS